MGAREGKEAKMRLKFLAWVTGMAALETRDLGKGKRGKWRRKTHRGT